VNNSTITSGSVSQRLAHVMSKSHGMVLMLMGRVWSAQEAAAWGTVRMTRASMVLMDLGYCLGDKFDHFLR